MRRRQTSGDRQPERDTPEQVGVETLLSVALLEGLFSSMRGELEEAVLDPARQEAE